MELKQALLQKPAHIPNRYYSPHGKWYGKDNDAFKLYEKRLFYVLTQIK